MFELLAQQHHIRAEEPHPIAILIAAIIVYVILFAPLFLIAKKTRGGPPVMAFIPFLNILLMTSIAEVSVLWAVGLFIPIVNLVATVVIWMGICTRCRKEPLLGLLMLVPGVNVLLIWYLALSD